LTKEKVNSKFFKIDFTPAKSLKGSTGSIKDIHQVKNTTKVLSVGYDRFLRIFDYKTYEDLPQIYLKNKLNVVYVYEIQEKEEKNEDDEEDEIEDDEDLMEEGEYDDEDEEEVDEEYEDVEENNNAKEDEGNLDQEEEYSELSEENNKKNNNRLLNKKSKAPQKLNHDLKYKKAKK
jgi:hypothetical protein